MRNRDTAVLYKQGRPGLQKALDEEKQGRPAPGFLGARLRPHVAPEEARVSVLSAAQ